jgi:hypothetical protein
VANIERKLEVKLEVPLGTEQGLCIAIPNRTGELGQLWIHHSS